jgi:molybdate transport system substrate-binding protein
MPSTSHSRAAAALEAVLDAARRAARDAGRRALLGAACCAAPAFAVGCAPQERPDELVVAAASDLALAMPALAAAFEEATGTRLTVMLGSSGQIAQQVLQGAPVDVFLSADRVWVERLAEAGMVAPAGRQVYARGRLALVTAGHRAPFNDVHELAAAEVRRVAIANPEHAPYGRAAREALQSAGAWEAMQPRLVFAENVRQALQFVASGNADAAIAALPLMPPGAVGFSVVPEALHAPLLQEAALIAGRPREQAAREFLRFLTGEDGRVVLAQYRFVLPDGDR